MSGHPFYSVVLAGGSGTRLWPLSRAGNPKFLHALTGTSDSLLQATVARLAPLAPMESTFVVTGVSHAAAVARQLPHLPDANLLVEPSPRDSCAAIGLAAAVIARRDPDAVMGSFASDHLIQADEVFAGTIRSAIAGAHEGWLMTVGIKPTHAETGYGYLQCGAATGAAVAVTEFKEKPSREVAEAYLASGRYLWNASMFVWRVGTFLDELKRQQSELFDGLSTIAAAWETADQDRVLGEIWPQLPRISVDHAVMEGAADLGLVATVPGDFGWTDVGDFDTLGQVLAGPRTATAGDDRLSDADPTNTGLGGDSMGGRGSTADDAGNVVLGEPKAAAVLLSDTMRSVVAANSGRLVVLLGISDTIVVDTPDALLVCARDRAQDIKSVVDELKLRGDTDDYL